MSSQWWIILFCIVIFILATQLLSQDDWDQAGKMIKSWTKDEAASFRPHGQGGTSQGEERCRRHLEKRFGQPFPKVRPPFLFNSVTKSTLELDGYCEPLKLAFEYNGRQHYEYCPHFHKNKTEFYNGKYRDEMKAKLCKQHGVHLIVVPHDCGDEASFIDATLSKIAAY